MSSKILAALELNDYKSYVMKYFLPIFLVDLLVLFLFLFGFSNVYLKWLGIALFFIIMIILYAYPIMIMDKQAKEIDQHIHYFITYTGALSTVNLARKELFVDLSEKKRYAEIASIFKKLIYLVESIKIDFSTASYKLASLIKTEHFARFLERMGIALSFSADISKFFLTEQKALMNSYENIYREGLERIRLIQDMFVSLIMAFAFVFATVLLLPFLSGLDAVLFLQFGIIAITFLDIAMIIFARMFIPKDKLYHDMGLDEGRQRTVMVFIGSLILSLILVPIVIFFEMPFMLKIAIICTPFLATGMYSNMQEKQVWKRDLIFPAFIRSLGDVHQSKGGTLTTTIETLLPHNFGILNDMLDRLYKRLKITSDKFTSWFYFSKESGSALIAEFMDTFVTVVYRGGSAEVAGAVVSDNMSRINALREMKKEFSSTLKGNIYGTYFGFALTIYISLLISVLLFRIFASLTEGMEGMALNMIQGVLPTGNNDTYGPSSFYIGITLTIHAVISAFMIKDVDGGNRFGMLFDMVILMWMGALIEIVINLMFKGMFSQYF